MIATEAPAVYEWTGTTGVKFRDVREPSGTYFHDTTPRPVVEALERARVMGSKVRLFYGDRETGRDWGEENDVVGRVGRSMGPIKVPILLRSSRSSGGGAILCDCIVRMMVDGREVYRQANYHQPAYKVCGSDMAGYEARVEANGETVARFKKATGANRWVAFMRGERMAK